MEDIRSRLELVRSSIIAAAARIGRDPAAVRLVAVSKRKPVEAVREARGAGQLDFGENYVPELLEKQARLASDLPDLRWHFIGHLQRNKVRKIVDVAALIHSVDSLRLLEEIDKRASGAGRVVPILLQVNLSGEETKSGCEAVDLPALARTAAGCRGVRLDGLMTMPPPVEDPEEVRPIFAELRALRDELRETLDPRGERGLLGELSMGMTQDYEVAIEEGATLIRIGQYIFGQRS